MRGNLSAVANYSEANSWFCVFKVDFLSFVEFEFVLLFIKNMNHVSCPFDSAHVVESRKLQAHLIKCKRVSLF